MPREYILSLTREMVCKVLDSLSKDVKEDARYDEVTHTLDRAQDSVITNEAPIYVLLIINP